MSLLSPQLFAQAAITADGGATLEILESRLREAEASSELDEAARVALLDHYRKAISLIEQQRSYEKSTAEFIKARESSPKQTSALRKQVTRLESRAPPKLPDSLSRKGLSELELVAEVLALLRADMPGAELFAGVQGNPTQGNVEAGVQAFRDASVRLRGF